MKKYYTRKQEPDEKHHSIFLRFFNKDILKWQHAESAAKSAKINVLEPLKLKNVKSPIEKKQP